MGDCCGKYRKVPECPADFFDLEALDIDGNNFKFQDLKNGQNKAFLIMNVATY